MTLGDWLSSARLKLKAAGCADWDVDPEWMITEVLGLRRSSISRNLSADLAPEALFTLEGYILRRERGEPLQYVLGTAAFMDLTLIADSRALIPRPETEILCEAAIAHLRDLKNSRALDICTGSGAICAAIKRHCPAAQVSAGDISYNALALALGNLKLNSLAVRLRHSDMLAAFAGEEFDLITCNPPYINSSDLRGLQREVGWEPALALDGGPDGLMFYRRLAAEAGPFLAPGGRMFVEVGAGQADEVAKMLSRIGRAGIINDLSGIGRVVSVKKEGCR